MSVKAHRYEGAMLILVPRTGGEVMVDASLVAAVGPDEVPYPETAVEAVEGADPAVQSVAAPSPPPEYEPLIAQASAQHGVDPALVRAVIHVESRFERRARSPKGAMGLMQLMPATAREYRVRNAYDPAANIFAGVKKLKGVLETFKDNTALALAAYNAGEGAVAKFNGIPPYRETQNYVRKILSISGLK